MELHQLRQHAHQVLVELVARADKRGQLAVPTPPSGSNDEQVLLAYAFRWLWENSEPGPNGQVINNRPLRDALAEAAGDLVSSSNSDKRLKPLRGHISNALEENGLIARPYTRAWRWTLLTPDGEPLVAETSTAVALPAGTAINGQLPTLGETLTVVGLQLAGDDTVHLTTRRGDGEDLVVTIGWQRA